MCNYEKVTKTYKIRNRKGVYKWKSGKISKVMNGLYQISNLGRVKSLKYRKSNEERILVLNGAAKHGYYMVGLCKNHKRKYTTVHRLVAEAFIPNPENKPQINHKDENRRNNHVDNLEWVTAKENLNYGSHNEKMTDTMHKVLSHRVLCVETGQIYNSMKEAARKTGVSLSGISLACKNHPIRDSRGHWYTPKTAGSYHWEIIPKIEKKEDE